MSDISYVIITPVRNEAEYLGHTIDSVCSQTVLPALWVIVNDGSSDETGEIAKAAAEKHDWIRVVNRPDRGYRKPGGGVVDAYYDGYSQIGSVNWDYVVKLDGDLSFSPDYFEQCFARFQKDERLGIGGGTICKKEVDGRLVCESTVDPRFHVRGATKIYRRQCWEKIGGLIRNVGWDTVDEVTANMLGWNTYSFPDVLVHQHRPTGQAQGVWKDWFKGGRVGYVSGYHPLFMFCKCISRLKEKPYGVVSVALWLGFVSAYLKQIPRGVDREFMKYFRDQQMRRLTMRENLWSRH